MTIRLSLFSAGLLAAVFVAQPALAQVKLLGSSGKAGSSNPQEWTRAVVGPDDENLYEIHITNGSTTYIRGLDNNVDAVLAGDGWTAPFWGESYRDGQHIAYNPNDGLLYHRNGTTGYRDAATDPRAYDTRLIETYDPHGKFTVDRVKAYKALTDRLGDPVNDRVAPNHPIEGDIFGGTPGFSYDPFMDWFILTDDDSDVGVLGSHE